MFECNGIECNTDDDSINPKSEPVKDSVNSFLGLVELHRGSLEPKISEQESTEPILSVFIDICRLLRSHSSQLSVALRPPITQSVATKCLFEVSSTLPGLVAAFRTLSPMTVGRFYYEEIRYLICCVFDGMETLVCDGIGGRPPRSGAKYLVDRLERRDRVSSTGVIWDACDRLEEMIEMGVVGYALLKLQHYIDILDDGIGELERWIEGSLEDWDDEGFGFEKFELSDKEETYARECVKELKT
ncbi:hypothetical protein NEOLI_000610, partial [Neolecta irregularis DAH-3]